MGSKVDWPGNITFALGLVLIMVSITYGIRPYGHHAMGWISPRVLILAGSGVLSLIAFAIVELRAREPMFRLPLLRIRAFTAGTLSTFLASVSRGGLMFMLIIWLQGIWLPQHGVDFTQTPLRAGLCMLPLTVGMLVSGPHVRDPVGPLRRARVRDRRDDRHGADVHRPVAAADQLLIPGVRARAVGDGVLDGDVRLPQPRGR